MKGPPPSASCSAPPEQLLFFAQLAGPPIGGGLVYIYRGVWLPCPTRSGPAILDRAWVNRGRNGEVWTSPRRESPRLPGRSQRPGGTSSPKADGLYKSCWRIAARMGDPYPRIPPPGARRQYGVLGTFEDPRLRAADLARAGPGQGPSHAQKPPTRQLTKTQRRMDLYHKTDRTNRHGDPEQRMRRSRNAAHGCNRIPAQPGEVRGEFGGKVEQVFRFA